MLNNFEDITHELTAEEKNTILPIIVNGLNLCIGKSKAYTNKQIVDAVKGKYNIKLNGPRLRKLIQYIRINDLVPLLVATSKGYYVSEDKEEIRDYIHSLEQRLHSIHNTTNSLKKQYIAKYEHEYQSNLSLK